MWIFHAIIMYLLNWKAWAFVFFIGNKKHFKCILDIWSQLNVGFIVKNWKLAIPIYFNMISSVLWNFNWIHLIFDIPLILALYFIFLCRYASDSVPLVNKSSSRLNPQCLQNCCATRPLSVWNWRVSFVGELSTPEGKAVRCGTAWCCTQL